MVLPDIVPIEHAAARHDGLVLYEEFAGPLRTPPKPPCFIFGTMPGHLAPDLYGETEIGAVGCFRLRDARIVYDGIVLQRSTAFWSLALNQPRHHVQAVLSAQAAGWATLPVRHIEGPVAVIHGPGYDIFGHWLVDFLPRLYGLHRAGFNIETLCFVLPKATQRVARLFLNLIGIPDKNLVWHDQLVECIAADDVLVPTLYRLRNRFHPLFVPATRFWRERFDERAGVPQEEAAERRIFVSRRNLASARQLRNRAAIETCAADAGYEIVCPETLSIQQQIRLFRSATRIFGEYGSGLHGSIFARPGSLVCALRGTSHHPGFLQSGLAASFEQNAGYVFGEAPQHAGDHPFSIDVDAFKTAMRVAETWA
jgi:capsular polysaccharide biosynthesis protein